MAVWVIEQAKTHRQAGERRGESEREWNWETNYTFRCGCGWAGGIDMPCPQVVLIFRLSRVITHTPWCASRFSVFVFVFVFVVGRT